MLEKLVSDKRLYIENLINLTDKNRNVRPFRFNKPQEYFFNNQTNRDIILKAAQLGFTSLIGAMFLVDCITTPGTVSVLVAHEEFITQRLLSRVKFYESTIPEKLKPPLHHKSAYELTWPDIHSTFYIGSARSYVFGRGERITNFHASEIAFWAYPENIMVPVLERANKVILESTPFGEGTYYHRVCQEAMSGNSNWKLHFFPWWWGEDYRLSPDDERIVIPADQKEHLILTPEEESLSALHNLDEDQIRWRRWKIRELKQDFWQEYPEDPETCFYSSEVMVFDKDTMDWLARQCYPAPSTYNNWDIWEKPEPDGFYIMGADPTVGAENKAAAAVFRLDCPIPRHVATLRGLYEPDIFADKLAEGGRYYFNCIEAVEANNSGVAVLSKLCNVLGYNNLYYRHDLVSGRASRQLGWLTTQPSKTYMIAEMCKHIRMDNTNTSAGIETHDINLVREMRNLRYSGIKAVSTGEDDLLMASMIALAARDTAVKPPQQEETYGWNW